MMEQTHTQAATARATAAAAPAPAGYVRTELLAQLQDERIFSCGVVVHKHDGRGRVAIYPSPFAAWTPVTERMPDDETLVLIALNDDDVWTGFRDAGVWRYPDATLIAHERVTHWMPVPTMPGAAA